MNNNEVCIVGLGPAGVSAAIYLKRYGMEPVCYEKELVGGKVNKTERIENYAGILSVKGPDLGMTLEDQLAKFNIKVNYEEVTEVSLNEDGSFKVSTSYGSKDYRYVILANGLGERPFPIAGEDTFKKRGISRCAICDGNFFKNKNVAVIGAGNSAFEEALYLSDICSHVTLVARRNEYRAQESIVEQLKKKENATILSPYVPVLVKGTDTLEQMVVENRETGEQKALDISGLFLYVGEMANTSFVKIPQAMDEKGILVTDDHLETKVKNLYAVGDCRDTLLRQVATATSDGALAASFIHEDYQKL
jgi:hypothetical protein